MSYIPNEHLKYNILPKSRKENWEVVSYNESLLLEIIDNGCDLSFPYHPNSLEEYYSEIDDCIEKYPDLKNLLNKYKNDLINRNNKLNWGIIKYNGKTTLNFTNGQYYYVPIYKMDDKYIIDGIIDNEEFTAYNGWEDVDFSLKNFEIIYDPLNIMKNKLF